MKALLAAVSALALVVTVPALSSIANANTSDYANIDFAAALPSTYNHATGGGAYDNGGNDDVVESLEGGDFVCGDTVTFFASIENDGGGAGAADDPETVKLNFQFSSATTNGGDVGFIDVTNVQVNRGAV